MLKGTVKFYNPEKSFGFIAQDSGEKDLFVHKSGLIDNVREGDKVEYEIESGPKGLNATNVKKSH